MTYKLPKPWDYAGKHLEGESKLAGATPITRGTGRIDKSGVLVTSMSIRFGGVKPLLLNLGRGGLWVNLYNS